MSTSVEYCLCGSKLTAFSNPPDLAKAIIGEFWTIHAGEGHEPTDAATARRARRRQERNRD